MKRSSFIRNSAFAFGALTLANKKILGLPVEDPWKIKMLTDEIGIFTEKGGTIGFYLSPKGIVVVDAQFPEQSQHLIDELKKRSHKSFRLLINTHHHLDHTAGNISFMGIVNRVAAHENSLKNQKIVAEKNKNTDKQLYPDTVYRDVWTHEIAKEKITMYYYGPAHTDGDSYVHFENANIVHCGDLVFNRRHPFVDRSAGANISSWIKVLDTGVKKFDSKTQYIFGHAANGYEVTGTADDLRKFGDYLGKVLVFVDSEIKAGKTKDEILKAKAIPGADEWKGDGIERPLGAAYDELTAK